jgi:hypothetical protein
MDVTYRMLAADDGVKWRGRIHSRNIVSNRREGIERIFNSPVSSIINPIQLRL